MADRQVRHMLETASVVLIVIILIITAGLNYLSFRKNYLESVVSSYAVVAGKCKRSIEYSVRFGKPLTRLYGMQELLQEMKDSSPEITNVRVLLPDGGILYDLNQENIGNTVPPKLIQKNSDFNSSQLSHSFTTIFLNAVYHILIPAYDRNDVYICTIDISFKEDVILSRLNKYLGKNLFTMGMIAALAVAFQILSLSLINVYDEYNQIKKNRLLIVIFSILGTAQACFLILNVSQFKHSYLDMIKENSSLTAVAIEKDVNQVLLKGTPYTLMVGIKDWMAKIIQNSPEIESITILDSKGKELYTTSSIQGKSKADIERMGFILPLETDKSGYSGQILVLLSDGYIANKINNILLDAGTVMLISFFFSVELIMFFIIYISQFSDTEDETGKTKIEGYRVFRPLAFLMLISTSASNSFIPLQMKLLYQPIPGLSEKIALGLPISVDLLFATVATLALRFVMERIGIRITFFFGVTFLLIGTVLSALAPNQFLFILARGFVGLGYGVAWSSMSSMTAKSRDPSEKIKAMADVTAGSYAGNVCGSSIGAMIADRVGFSVVFMGGAVLQFFTFIAAFLYLKRLGEKKLEGSTSVKKTPMAPFFFDSNVMALFFLIVIPSMLCMVGFLRYFFPLLSVSLGISQSNIGRALMLYGICIIYLGPVVSKRVTRSSSVNFYAALSGFIAAVSILVFCLYGSFTIALFSILLLGVAESVGFSARISFLLRLKSTDIIGEGKASGFYATFTRLGQMFGPLVFGWVTTVGGARSIGLIGIIHFIIVFTFLLTTHVLNKLNPKPALTN